MTVQEMFHEITSLTTYVNISLSLSTRLIAQFEVDSIRPDGLTYNSRGLTLVKYGTSTVHFVLPETDQVTKASNESWISFDISYPDGARANVLVSLK